MSALGKVLDFTRSTDENGVNISEAKVDLGGGDIVTAYHYAAPGDDAHPLPGDYAVLVPGSGTGVWIAVGFTDPAMPLEAGLGERIIYSRSAPGVIAARIHLKADGSIDLNNGAAVLGPDGTLTVATNVVGGGKSLKTHTHPAGTYSVTAAPGVVSGSSGTPS